MGARDSGARIRRSNQIEMSLDWSKCGSLLEANLAAPSLCLVAEMLHAAAWTKQPFPTTS